MDYVSSVTGSFDMATPLHFELFALPANGDLNYVFHISAMLISANLTHKYSHTKSTNRLEFS